MPTTSKAGKQRAPRRERRAGEAPLRTCVVTREARPQTELLRLALLPTGEVAVDRSGKLPGRGAWVVPTREALELLQSRPGMLGRAFELENPGSLRADDLLAQARAVTRATMLDLLSLSARSGCLHSGADQVTAAVRGGQVVALLVAADASEQSVSAARGAREGIPVFRSELDREGLGRRIGKGPRAVVALGGYGPARALLEQLRRTDALR